MARRNRLVGFLLFFVIGIPVSACVFWAADEFQIGIGPPTALIVGLPFLVYVGRQYPNKLRDPSFVAFLTAWVVVHVAVFLLVLKYLGLAYYIPFAALELLAGYRLAIRRFGPPILSR
jgi:hypothetical protein